MTGSRQIRLIEQDFLVSEETIDFFGNVDRIVVDTSVAVKWFFHIGERHADKAKAILEDYYKNKIRIISPELMLFEISNVLKNKLDEKDAQNTEIIEKIFNLGIICRTGKNTLKNSLANAYEYSLSVYDGIFLTTAQYYNGQLITDDEKIFTNYSNKNNDGGVILLKDYGRQ